MKTLLTALTIVALAGTVYASDYDLVLNCYPNEAFLWNAGDNDIPFDGYSILSAGGNLDVAAFTGVSARLDGAVPGEGYTWLRDNFGNKITTFSLTTPSAFEISELSSITADYPVFKAGFRFSLGNVCPNGTAQDLGIKMSIPGLGDPPPVAIAGGPYLLDLDITDSITLDASGSVGTLEWDIDNDGHYGEVFGEQPTLTYQYLQSRGLGLGTHTIGLQAYDPFRDDGDTAATTLTIVPEPATMSLLALGALAMLRRRR